LIRGNMERKGTECRDREEDLGAKESRKGWGREAESERDLGS
jgi:hypothetical protein